MDDRDVVEALIRGERTAFGPSLHIEGDLLYARGWWHVAFRLAPNAFIVRNDEIDDDSSFIQLVSGQLSDHELRKVRDDHPLVQAVTYTEMSLAGPSWSVWAPDLRRGDAALAARAGADSLPRGLIEEDMEDVGDFSADLENARRVAGLPPSVILAVGLRPDVVRALQVALPECRFEQRQFGEIQPEACSTVTPALALIEAQGQRGREFIMELRAVACGRFLPVAAVAKPPELPLGADVSLAPDEPPANWRDSLVKLLP